MRTIYPEFFDPSDDEVAHFVTEATVVVDSNVLLALYRYSPGARDEALEVLGSVGDRLWIPYQVGLEFLRNRREVIGALGTAYNKALGVVAGLPEKASAGFGTGKRHETSRKAVDKLVRETVGKLQTALAELRDDDDARIDPSNDPILERITELFKDRIGSPPTGQAWRERVETFVSFRAPHKVPPGYEDVKDKRASQQAGDYLLWCEILDLAASSDRSVMFVTEDSKGDWFERDDTGKPLGPRRELVREFAEVSDRGYYQLTLDRFLELAKEHLGSTVDDETIGEVLEDRRAAAAYEALQRMTDARSWRLSSNRADQALAEEVLRHRLSDAEDVAARVFLIASEADRSRLEPDDLFQNAVDILDESPDIDLNDAASAIMLKQLLKWADSASEGPDHGNRSDADGAED